MSNTRSSKNPPAYYYTLNKKQQNNWRKNTHKIEKNENLREQYPPFRSSSSINIRHIHYQSTITMIDQLIKKATETKRYVVDTESQKGEYVNQGALIQIQFVHSINYSTIIIIEVKFLPDPRSMLFMKIKELCGIIFNNHNDIISWGPLSNEFRHFKHLDLVHLGKLVEYDLQSLFSNPDNEPITHPEMERRDEKTGYLSMVDDTSSDDDEDELDFDYNDRLKRTKLNQPVSLQKAIETTFNKFLDKSFTVNHWKCGLDLDLNTWKDRLFSQRQYDEQIEKQQRQKMQQYAVDDCTAVADLFFHMYPDKINDHLKIDSPMTTSTITTTNPRNDVSDISDDELPRTFFPRFDKPTATLPLEINQQIVPSLISSNNERYEPAGQTTSEEQQRIKAERQRKKNIKYKQKKQHQPNFQNKLKRPIYHRYDYRKIRAQLRDDGLHTSHQITINKNTSEVLIGFSSQHELERAKTIVRINYFSKSQYIDRWGERNTDDDEKTRTNNRSQQPEQRTNHNERFFKRRSD